MVDLIGILTRTLLGLSSPASQPAPAQPHIEVPLFMTPTAQQATSPSASDVVDHVQQFYASIKQVTAQFRQSVTNDMMGQTKTSDGTVWILKPGKMRWDYLEKKKDSAQKETVQVKKSFISNGTLLYVVEHDNKQVIKKSLGQDLMPVAVTFLYGKGDLKTEFNSEIDATSKYGNGKDDLVLKLTPKKPSAQYKALYLVVNKDDFHVTQSVIVDASNNVNQFRFFAPDFEKSIKDSWFEFDERSVKNYRVIDADQQQNQGSNAGEGTPPPAPAPKK